MVSGMEVAEMFAKIKALWAVLKMKKEAGKLMEDAKRAGWKTTEFWVNGIVMLITLYAGIAGILPATVTATVVSALAAVYTIARVVVKLTPSKADDEAIARIGKVLLEKLNVSPVDTTK